MIITTTPTIEGKKIIEYKSIVTGEESILGITSGRLSKACQKALLKVEEEAKKAGANAVVGVSIDYETPIEGMTLMVTASGTAVVIE